MPVNLSCVLRQVSLPENSPLHKLEMEGHQILVNDEHCIRNLYQWVCNARFLSDMYVCNNLFCMEIKFSFHSILIMLFSCVK